MILCMNKVIEWDYVLVVNSPSLKWSMRWIGWQIAFSTVLQDSHVCVMHLCEQPVLLLQQDKRLRQRALYRLWNAVSKKSNPYVFLSPL